MESSEDKLLIPSAELKSFSLTSFNQNPYLEQRQALDKILGNRWLKTNEIY